jgi:type IV pilus assembly protein PilM
MVLSWFASRVNPIAVDVGTDTIKLLQAEPAKDGQHRLVAAACEVIPEEIRSKTSDRDNFVTDAIRKMLGDGFRGKQVVTCLPAGQMAVQHLRMARMTADELVKALPFEAAGKLPFDAARAVLRHTLVGEVYQNQEAKQEVILMAAPREAVDRHLNLLSKAKVEVVGIHVEPTALIECFSHLFRRKGDENISTLFIDMGAGSTHVVIAHGKSMVFAKHVPIGGEHFNKSVAEAVKIDIAAAKELRIKVSHQQAQAVRLPPGVVGLGADGAATPAHPLGKQNAAATIGGPEADVIDKVNKAIAAPLDSLVAELQCCVRYYESIFPGRVIDRAIFVGGESRHVVLCQSIAQRLGVPATLGDPLARLSKDGVARTAVDLRQPQPGWAIAVGLGIGLSPAASE